MIHRDDYQDHAEEDRPSDAPIAGRPFRFHLPAMRQITQRGCSADHGGDRLLMPQLVNVGRRAEYETAQEKQDDDEEKRHPAYWNYEEHRSLSITVGPKMAISRSRLSSTIGDGKASGEP
jgi:hypothetical protein